MASLDELAHLAAIGALEEAELLNAVTGRQFHARDEAFDLSDRHFIRLFRLTKSLTMDLIDALDPYLVQPSRTSALDCSTKVLTALRFFAAGSYQLDTGSNINLAVSQMSVSRCVQEVSTALNNPAVFDQWVKFPSNLTELETIRNEFYREHAFPGVIGCVDCTHIAIVPPKGDDPIYPEHLYVNRKTYHSINVQLICDPNLRILHVNAKFPGSSNDAFIWNNCKVLPALQNLNRQHKTFYLLGDSGYALRPWLLTPLDSDHTENTPEAAYNASHKSTRATIERCNGVLKMRFRCLLKHRVLHYKPEKASLIINACIVLHNICIANNVPDPEPEVGDEALDFGMFTQGNADEMETAEEQATRRINPDLADARRLRRRLIGNYFSQ